MRRASLGLVCGAADFCIALITWLVNLCIYASIIGGFDGMWVVSLLFILLNMWWSIHVCKHPEMCELTPLQTPNARSEAMTRFSGHLA